MDFQWHTLTCLLAITLCAGCFQSRSTRCDAQKACFAADAIGCCDGSSIEVSVCDECPSGTVERSVCRTSGCVDPCEGRERIVCHVDIGAGCCGVEVFTESCDTCPLGTVPEVACTDGYLPACGCPEVTESRDAAPAPPADAGSDAGGPADAGAFFPAENCYEALGPNCCGAAVGSPAECGCPPGTLHEEQCFDYALGDDLDRAFLECRTHFGDGCCGEFVPADACLFECPAGSIPAETCDAVLEPSGERPGGGAPPADVAGCYEVDPDGCCGAPVEVNLCTGSCPAGSTMDCAFGAGCGV